MFYKVGDKIKKLAEIFMVVYVILIIVLFFMILFSVAEGDMDGSGLLIFLIFAGIFGFLAYIQSLMMYGYGKIVEDVERVAYRICTAENTVDTGSTPSSSAQSYRMESVESMNSYRPSPKPKPVQPVATQWQCKKCGKIMPDYVGSCGCGNTKHENENM